MDLRKLKNPSIIWRKLKRIHYVRHMRRNYARSGFFDVKWDLGVSDRHLFFKSDELGNLAFMTKEAGNESVRKDIAAAGEYLQKRFRFLAYDFHFGDGDIRWSYDPVTNSEWESAFAFDMVFRGPERLSDIKLPWELAKLQYLLILGKAYAHTEDSRYALAIISHMESWIDANPPLVGIHWASAFEVGIRVVSMILVYPFIENYLQNETRSKYLRSLYTQTLFIENNLSKKEYANNHLIGEAFTLMLAGLFLQSPRSDKWYKKGCHIFLSELRRQVHEDGVNKEQSYNYHRFVLDYYYMFIILHRRNGLPYPSYVDGTVEKMTAFIAASIMPNNELPNFGDGDDARGIYIKADSVHDNSGILGLGALLFNRNDFKFFVKEKIPDEIIWLMGCDAVKKYRAINAMEPAQKNFSFDQGGYYILRNGYHRESDYMVLDCGPLGMGIGGHGHSDALSFQLCKDGETFLVDSGTYSYNLDYELRDYFRSTAAHNAVTVDGLDQSEMRERMSWNSFADAGKLLHWHSEQFNFFGGEHNGYERLDDPVTAQRYIFYDGMQTWVVYDYFECKKQHVFDHHLHLDEACRIDTSDSGTRRFLIQKENKRLVIEYPGESGGNIKKVKGRGGHGHKRLGWISKKYGTLQETVSLHYRKSAHGNTSIMTVFLPGMASSLARLSKTPGCINFQFNHAEGVLNHFFYNITENAPPLHLENVCFKGKGLFLRGYDRKRGLEPEIVEALQFHALSIKGIVEIESTHMIEKLSKRGHKIIVQASSRAESGLSLDFDTNYSVVVNGKTLSGKTHNRAA